MNPRLLMVPLLLITGTCLAEIQVPAKVEVGKKIEAKLAPNIPGGAELAGQWYVVGCDTEPRGADILIWAAPGKHKIEYRGAWMKFEIVDVPQPDGSVKKVKSVLEWGSVYETAEFEVAGAVPPPDPPKPDPSPTGPYQILFYYTGEQLDNLPLEQRALMNSEELHARLVAQGHMVLGQLEQKAIDAGGLPARWQPWVDAVKGKTLPMFGIAPKSGGKVQIFKLPANEAEFLAILADPTKGVK